MNIPEIHKLDDGSVLIEWVLGENDYRFYISVETDPSESSWGFVTSGHAENGYLPEKLDSALRSLMDE